MLSLVAVAAVAMVLVWLHFRRAPPLEAEGEGYFFVDNARVAKHGNYRLPGECVSEPHKDWSGDGSLFGQMGPAALPPGCAMMSLGQGDEEKRMCAVLSQQPAPCVIVSIGSAGKYEFEREVSPTNCAYETTSERKGGPTPGARYR